MAITKVSTSMKTAPTSAEVTAHVTAFDDNQLKEDIALLAFKQATSDSVVKYDLVDQSIDVFSDASGVNAGSSTNETRDTTGKYYSGSTPATHRYWRAVIEVVAQSSQHLYHEARLSDAAGVITGLGSSNISTGSGSESLNIAYTDWTNMFDGNNSNYWLDDNGCAVGAWVQIDLGSGNEKSLTQVEFFMGSSSTAAQWAIQYSDDGGTGGTWVKVGDLNPSSTSQWNSVTVSAVNYQSLTLVSNAVTAETQPTKADLVMTYTNGAGTATIGSDLTAEVTRDGSNWTSFGLSASSDQGDTGGHTILTAHDIDISGQPAGSAMQYRIKTLNQSASKETRIHAVSLGWS